MSEWVCLYLCERVCLCACITYMSASVCSHFSSVCVCTAEACPHLEHNVPGIFQLLIDTARHVPLFEDDLCGNDTVHSHPNNVSTLTRVVCEFVFPTSVCSQPPCACVFLHCVCISNQVCVCLFPTRVCSRPLCVCVFPNCVCVSVPTRVCVCM